MPHFVTLDGIIQQPTEGRVVIVCDPLDVRNPIENATSEAMASNLNNITDMDGDNLRLGYPGAGSEQLTKSALPVKIYCTGDCFEGRADLRRKNDFVIEPLEAMTSFGGLVNPGVDVDVQNYAEAVGLDSSNLDTAITALQPANKLIG